MDHKPDGQITNPTITWSPEPAGGKGASCLFASVFYEVFSDPEVQKNLGSLRSTQPSPKDGGDTKTQNETSPSEASAATDTSQTRRLRSETLRIKKEPDESD